MNIEKGIPIPHKAGSTGRPAKYDFDKMEVGDSVLVDGFLATTQFCKAYGAAKKLQKRTGKKFSGRTQPEGKVRIWRIE